jgi:hypothetical protein
MLADGNLILPESETRWQHWRLCRRTRNFCGPATLVKHSGVPRCANVRSTTTELAATVTRKAGTSNTLLGPAVATNFSRMPSSSSQPFWFISRRLHPASSPSPEAAREPPSGRMTSVLNSTRRFAGSQHDLTGNHNVIKLGAEPEAGEQFQ